ncbi:hypothetical protein EYC80_010085 [Monilinia laxa]|uniref:Uncharacterized protein n=1 Tax=Monilinia laxa TaxID=61186 RepID=A0A5N6JSA2_MONLA|nr:hypothetical protein EYC80_010085 [Monilinia laxa]
MKIKRVKGQRFKTPDINRACSCHRNKLIAIGANHTSFLNFPPLNCAYLPREFQAAVDRQNVFCAVDCLIPMYVQVLIPGHRLL